MTLEGIIDINGLAEFKAKIEDVVHESLTYTEKIFIGVGADESAEMTPHEVGRSHEIIVSLEGQGYIWLAVPKNSDLVVLMGGFEVPFEEISETVIDDRLYTIRKSLNDYSFITEVGLILKY